MSDSFRGRMSVRGAWAYGEGSKVQKARFDDPQAFCCGGQVALWVAGVCGGRSGQQGDRRARWAASEVLADRSLPGHGRCRWGPLDGREGVAQNPL